MVAVTLGTSPTTRVVWAMARQIFGKVDVTRAQAMDSTVGKPNFRLARECDDVLPSGGNVPVAEIPRR